MGVPHARCASAHAASHGARRVARGHHCMRRRTPADATHGACGWARTAHPAEATACRTISSAFAWGGRSACSQQRPALSGLGWCPRQARQRRRQSARRARPLRVRVHSSTAWGAREADHEQMQACSHATSQSPPALTTLTRCRRPRAPWVPTQTACPSISSPWRPRRAGLRLRPAARRPRSGVAEERGQAPPAALLRRLIAARSRSWAAQWYGNRWWLSARQRAGHSRALRAPPDRHDHRLHTNHPAKPTAPHAIRGARRSHARRGGALIRARVHMACGPQGTGC